jgi:hypothetical protein
MHNQHEKRIVDFRQDFHREETLVRSKEGSRSTLLCHRKPELHSTGGNADVTIFPGTIAFR